MENLFVIYVVVFIVAICFYALGYFVCSNRSKPEEDMCSVLGHKNGRQENIDFLYGLMNDYGMEYVKQYLIKEHRR